MSRIETFARMESEGNLVALELQVSGERLLCGRTDQMAAYGSRLAVQMLD